jgi:hypothetical protein
MSTIVLRLVKGSALTWSELDDNFSNLNTDKYEAGDNAQFGTLYAATYTNLPGVTAVQAGIVPASGGGITNFLRADGTWAPVGGGGGWTESTTAPLSPVGGDRWLDTTTMIEYTWVVSEANWVEL